MNIFSLKKYKKILIEVIYLCINIGKYSDIQIFVRNRTDYVSKSFLDLGCTRKIERFVQVSSNFMEPGL